MKRSLGSATGVSGTLCYSGDGDYFLRVTQPDGGFDDYWLRHYDLEVTVTDTSAWFYEGTEAGDQKVLDYCPNTLGITDEDLAAYNEERLVSRYDKGAVE